MRLKSLALATMLTFHAMLSGSPLFAHPASKVTVTVSPISPKSRIIVLQDHGFAIEDLAQGAASAGASVPLGVGVNLDAQLVRMAPLSAGGQHDPRR